MGDRRPEVVIESVGGGRFASVCDVEPPGSISVDTDAGRQVYLFGWLDGVGPSVWRSTAGLDVANPTVRVVVSTGLERLVDLSDGPYELDYRRGDRVMRIRLRLVEP